jgi:hypothetical protein
MYEEGAQEPKDAHVLAPTPINIAVALIDSIQQGFEC